MYRRGSGDLLSLSRLTVPTQPSTPLGLTSASIVFTPITARLPLVSVVSAAASVCASACDVSGGELGRRWRLVSGDEREEGAPCQCGRRRLSTWPVLRLLDATPLPTPPNPGEL
ncbi:unnamed protein product [Boreogadus saida]